MPCGAAISAGCLPGSFFTCSVQNRQLELWVASSHLEASSSSLLPGDTSPSIPFLSPLYLSFSFTTHIQSGSKPLTLHPSTRISTHLTNFLTATLAWLPSSPASEYCLNCPLRVDHLLPTLAGMIISNVNLLSQHHLWFLLNYPTISLRTKTWHSSHSLGGTMWSAFCSFSKVTSYSIAFAHSFSIWWIAILQRPPIDSYIGGVTCFFSLEWSLSELPLAFCYQTQMPPL